MKRVDQARKEELLKRLVIDSMRKVTIFFLSTFVSLSSFAQTYVWQGNVDNDFYNESNWLVEGTADSPVAGSIDRNSPIGANLTIVNSAFDLAGDDLVFANSELTLVLSNTALSLRSSHSGAIKLDAESTLILHADAPLLQDAKIDLQDDRSWIKFLNVDPNKLAEVHLSAIETNEQPIVPDENVRVDMYYFGGSLVRLKNSSYKPLTLFDGKGQAGESLEIESFKINSDEELGGFDNRASSFILERGYVACMAIFQNGTGKSEVFIASEESLKLDLPEALNNTVSFIRVVPWNWVTKKGASKFIQIGTTWTYNWNRNAQSLPDLEYAPMAWGYGGAQLGVLPEYINMEDITHVMGFNESDNCNDQSGQFNDLCQIDVAVPTFKNLMRTGLRLVSPSPRENGPLPGRWLSEFRDRAVETDVRYDVLGVHWYDWANNPQNSPFADPQDVFNRFKNYLDRVYEEHQMPIWITEFNANANRDVSVHQGFLELALPYLESLDFIERYDYFEPNPEIANNRDDITFAAFYAEDGSITELGRFYRDFESTPSVPETTWAGSDMLADLEGKVNLTMQLDKQSLNEGEVLTISFATDRSVGAAESFNIEVDLGEEQYTLRADLVELQEGARTAEVTLVAVDDDAVEDVMIGAITLSNLSSGIAWDGNPVTFSLVSEDEEVVIPLGLEKGSIFTMFPNPTSKLVTLQSNVGIKYVKVLSIDGKEQRVNFIDENTLDIEQYPSGVYLIKATLKNGDFKSAMIRKN
ncbi:MAG: glycosyl hydrolase [Bacteroidota bacterium]